MWQRIIVICIQITFVFTANPLCQKKNGFFIMKNDCTRFYRCVHGDLVQNQTCPKGTLFNIKTLVCDHRTNAPTECTAHILGTAENEISQDVEFAEEHTPGPDEWQPTVGPTTPMEDLPKEGFKDEYKVVCYFTSWSFYRKEDAKFIPEDINPYYCTHLIYAFATLDRDSLTIRIHDRWADIENRFYKRILKLKTINQNLKVLLALGGWNDSEDDKYSRLVADENSTSKFINHALQFVQKHGFDGLDIDWEFPGCPQAKCTTETDDSKMFAIFIRELKVAMTKNNYLLSAAVSSTKHIIDKAYDVSSMNENFDFINLMAYDYYGAWSDFAETHSPLFTKPSIEDADKMSKYKSVNFSVTYWIEKGMSPQKIVLGVPFYGRAVALKKKTQKPNYGLGDPIFGPASSGKYTNEPGFLSYYEVCDLIKTKEYKKHRDQYSGTYIENGKDFIGYDDVKQLVQKMSMIKHYKLGGAMVWSIDMDDFRGNCCSIKYPLLKTVNSVLRGVTSFAGIKCA
ncbi:chitinase-like protein [Leptotrombidium deliense]|uniref:Chitinase-like protein n=1 Tax=Leptotrombidium deliense TaxID=299467 RepID=A0A443SG70_9ACAR|nr:chitinase-like protein [Leptotrombidium deliense]